MEDSIRILNCSKQMIALQIRAPNSDFYTNEQQARILPGKDVVIPRSYIIEEQIKNLQARGMIRTFNAS